MTERPRPDRGWPPGLMVSAPPSGAGKTTVTLGLLRAFAEDGLTVRPFKSGPDYIDPAFHRAAAGRASFNLDTWAMDGPLREAVAAQAAGADLCVAEGSMGLYNGVATRGLSGSGSSAETAARFGWPVALVLDVSGQAQSAAAAALGFARYAPDLPFAGVILNRVASPRHERLARLGMERAGPAGARRFAPARRSGVARAASGADPGGRAPRSGGRHRRLRRLPARACRSARAGRAPAPGRLPPPPAQRIALAQDAAFSFAYPHVLAGWRAAGAEIVPFSPLADEPPARDADLVWLPGGYPELHAGRLAGAARFMAGLRAHAATRPVHGECGGYMTLGAALIDSDGARHAMAELLGLVTSYARRRLHLGYRGATLAAPMPGLAVGARLRGREFHYSTILEQPDAPLAAVTDADGAPVAETGSRRGAATGTFFHLIAAERP